MVLQLAQALLVLALQLEPLRAAFVNVRSLALEYCAEALALQRRRRHGEIGASTSRVARNQDDLFMSTCTPIAIRKVISQQTVLSTGPKSILHCQESI